MCRTGKRSALPWMGTVGMSKWGMAEDIGRAFAMLLLRIRLLGGRGVRECRQRRACGFDAQQRRVRREIEIDAPRVRHLRHEADVGDRRRIAVAEASGRRIAGEL